PTTKEPDRRPGSGSSRGVGKPGVARCSFTISPWAPKSTLFPYTTLFRSHPAVDDLRELPRRHAPGSSQPGPGRGVGDALRPQLPDRKSTRLNSSHVSISYAVFCLKKKTSTGFEAPPTAPRPSGPTEPSMA